MLKKIISGGQTGADRAGLDATIAHGIEHGGAIPKGRLTEDGPLSSRYKLDELSTSSYPARTEKNVTDSDGTVILSHGALTQGSLLTFHLAEKHGKVCLHLDLDTMSGQQAASELVAFIETHEIEVLNVAGPRASGDPAIYDAVYKVMAMALSYLISAEEKNGE